MGHPAHFARRDVKGRPICSPRAELVDGVTKAGVLLSIEWIPRQDELDQGVLVKPNFESLNRGRFLGPAHLPVVRLVPEGTTAADRVRKERAGPRNRAQSRGVSRSRARWPPGRRSGSNAEVGRDESVPLVRTRRLSPRS